MATQEEIQSFVEEIQESLVKAEARLDKLYQRSLEGLRSLPANADLITSVQQQTAAASVSIKAAHNALGLAAAAHGAEVSGGGDKPK